MSETPGFTPNSPLTRKPKRSYLFLLVLICIAVGGGLYVFLSRALPPGQAGAIAAAAAVVLRGVMGFLLRPDWRFPRRLRDWLGFLGPPGQ